MKKTTHVIFVIAALFLMFGLPSLYYGDRIQAVFAEVTNSAAAGSADAVSSASIEIPDQPSGEFYVFVNSEKHMDTLSDWENFFLEKEVDVIFEDLDCITIDGDVLGFELAKRFQARLAENQMTVKKENAVLGASKLDSMHFDVMVVSSEVANSFGLIETYDVNRTKLITLKAE